MPVKHGKKYNYKGTYMTVCELSLLSKIDPGTISGRLHRGWSVEKAIQTMPKGRTELGIWPKDNRQNNKEVSLIIEQRILEYRQHNQLKKKTETEIKKAEEWADAYIHEKNNLNIKAVDDFFNPDIGEGSDLDPDDSDKRINALKRSFALLYKPQNQTP